MRTNFVPDTVSLSAFHLRCGEQTATKRVAQWLAQHEVSTHDSADVYTASADIVLGEIAACHLFVAGVDWLTDNELPVVTAVARHWPYCQILVYTGLMRPLPAWPTSIRIVRGQYELERCLSQSPQAWLANQPARVAPQSASSERRSMAVVPHPTMRTETPAGNEAPEPPAPPEHSSGEALATEQAPSAETDLPPLSLTPEELAALLARD